MGFILGRGAQPAEGGILRVYNGDTVTISRGMLAIWMTASVPASGGTTIAVLKSTATGNLATVAGVALDDIAPGEVGEICQWGVCEVQVAHGASVGDQVAQNDSLSSSGTVAGKARDGTGVANRFGYALTAATEKVTGGGFFVTAAVDVRRLNTAFGRS